MIGGIIWWHDHERTVIHPISEFNDIMHKILGILIEHYGKAKQDGGAESEMSPVIDGQAIREEYDLLNPHVL